MNNRLKFRGKDVLVTGANGFVGSHLIQELVKKGADVTAFVFSGQKGHRNIRHLEDELSIVRGDLRDYRSVKSAIDSLNDGSMVFHLGAQAHVGESWDRPYETVDTNIRGTLNVLEAARSSDTEIKKINVAGSSEEYGNSVKEGDSIDESHKLQPESVYATSKVSADMLAMNYHDAYGVPALTTRMFNCFGPRQSPRYITGTVITQALEREKIELGNLEPRRDFSFIKDGVRGHIAAMNAEPGEQYNFGSGRSYRIREWVEKILRVGSESGYWDEPEIVQSEERYRPGSSEVDELKADYSKLQAQTGWKPENSVEEGILETVSWYADNRDRWIDRTDWC